MNEGGNTYFSQALPSIALSIHTSTKTFEILSLVLYWSIIHYLLFLCGWFFGGFAWLLCAFVYVYNSIYEAITNVQTSREILVRHPKLVPWRGVGGGLHSTGTYRQILNSIEAVRTNVF